MNNKKTIFVSGAGQDLGKAIVQRCAQNPNYNFILHYYKSKIETETLATEIGCHNIIQADLSNKKEVASIAPFLKQADIMINTVGSFFWQTLIDTPIEDFEYCIQNNLMTAWYLSKHCIPAMCERGFGRIINFGSIACDQITTRPMTTPYYIAKTSTLIMTKTFAQELQGTNVTINMISPGVLPSGKQPNPQTPIIPFDRIADEVYRIISDENIFINGANIDISAGWRP